MISVKTAVSLVSSVRIWLSLFPPLRLGPGSSRVHFDLNLYRFAIFFGQSKVAYVKMKAQTLVYAKNMPKKWGKHSKLKNFIADLYLGNVLEGFTINTCQSNLCFGR